MRSVLNQSGHTSLRMEILSRAFQKAEKDLMRLEVFSNSSWIQDVHYWLEDTVARCADGRDMATLCFRIRCAHQALACAWLDTYLPSK